MKIDNYWYLSVLIGFGGGDMIISGEIKRLSLHVSECVVENLLFDYFVLKGVLTKIEKDSKQEDPSFKAVFEAVLDMATCREPNYLCVTKTGVVVLSTRPVDHSNSSYYLVATDRDAVHLQWIMARVLEVEENSVARALKMFKVFADRMPDFEDDERVATLDGASFEERTRLLAQYVRPIEELEFTQRTYNCLRNGNIHYIGDLVTKKENDLLKVKNFGRKSFAEVKNTLESLGLSLKTEMSADMKQEFENMVRPA